MTRSLVLLVLLVAVGAFAVVAAPADEPPMVPVEQLVAHEQTIRYLRAELGERTRERDKARYRVRRQYLRIARLNGEVRRATHKWPSIHGIIAVAATAYGQSYTTLLRKARCESNLRPFARNPSGASGLFQFLRSTWDSTPFRDHSVYDPYAASLAASWMHSHLRGGEWSCK